MRRCTKPIWSRDLTPYDPAYTSGLADANRRAGRDGRPGGRPADGARHLYHGVVAQANLLAYLENFRWFALVAVACFAACVSPVQRRCKVSGPFAAVTEAGT